MGNCQGEQYLVALYHYPESKADHSQCSMDEYDSRTGLSSPIYGARTYTKSYYYPCHSYGHKHSSDCYPDPRYHCLAFHLPRDLYCPPGRYAVSHCLTVRDQLHGTSACQWNPESKTHLSRTTTVHSIASYGDYSVAL